MKFSEMPYHRVTWEEIEPRLEEYCRRFEQAADGEAQYEVYREVSQYMDDCDTEMTIASIRHGSYMDDPFYEAEQDYYDKIWPLISNAQRKLTELVVGSRWRGLFEEKLGRMALANMDMSLKAFDEKIIGLMQEENALRSRYEKLIAGIRIDWDGEELNLSLLRKYMMSQDREERRRACRKRGEALGAHGEELDEIYDLMVKNRTEQARQLGYENYVELGYLRMRRSCYGREQVERFRRQVKDFLVPLAEKMHEERRRTLGLEKLYFCDELVHLPEGDPRPIGTPEEILANGRRMYHELSPETAEFIDFMMDNELFDVLGRKNKKAGGYMTFLPKYHAPFIFANFNGTSGDTDVLTHECGHAFQGYLNRNAEIADRRALTMETAEIHSMSMEFFTERWMELFYGDGASAYRKIHLEDAIYFIPYGCMVDEFQHIVYSNPDMTPAERRAAWTRLEHEYKPHLDYEGDPFFENGGYWQMQHHIFSAPFYYIDYCLAQTCALAFKVKMDQDFAGAWKQYLELCQAGGADFAESLVCGGLPSPFADGTMKKIVEGLHL